MQAYNNYQSAIDYIFGVTDTIGDQTYESLSNGNLKKTSSVRSIEAVSIRLDFVLYILIL